MLHEFRNKEVYAIKESGTSKHYYATKEYAIKMGYEILKGTHLLSHYEHDFVSVCAPLTFKTPIHRLNNTLQIVTEDGSLKTIYQFGSGLWFDTEQERDEYKAQYWQEQNELRELNAIKNAIKEKINQMSKEQLEQLLATL